ncbi:MAG: hypothetical protein B7733_18040 [Myxococcales bacterium FL481]|nr:MAG: hypothetical protein B7733_18040 [Myxococcales bacterium FL481]
MTTWTCARCHTLVTESDEPLRCAACGAEAGFESTAEPTGPMTLFAALVTVVVVGSVASSLLVWGFG